jgi:CTP:molybdopterin cytidylyltransferase MocA
VKPAGIILAAGLSSRMGRDKATLPYRGSTFLNRLIGLLAPRVEPLVVVLGHNAELIRPTIRPDSRVACAVNPNFEQGMLSSLQIGIRALPAGIEAALFTLVDLPAVAEDTVDRLLAAFESGAQPLTIPRCAGRRGHPVFARNAILDEIAALPTNASAKTVIHAHRSETLFVEVNDDGIFRDVDVPEDYAALVPEQ